MLKISTCVALSLMVLSSAQAKVKVILRQDIKDPVELRDYDKRLKAYNLDLQKTEPLVLGQAVAETEKLTNEIMKVNVAFGVKKMYPRWKKKLIVMAGGEQELIKIFAGAVKKMNARGVAIVDITVKQPKKVHYVWPKRKKGMGVVYYPMDYNIQKLVIVPTDITIHIPDPKKAEPIKILKKTFQVAIFDTATNQWSFIDGSDLTVNDIRGLFPLLPKAVEKEMVKGGKQLN